MSEREWGFYVEDMLRFAEKLREYSRGLDQAAFESDELRYDAILKIIVNELAEKHRKSTTVDWQVREREDFKRLI